MYRFINEQYDSLPLLGALVHGGSREDRVVKDWQLSRVHELNLGRHRLRQRVFPKSSVRLALSRHADEEFVPPGVRGDLGMERGGHQLFLLHRDDDLLEALVVDLRPLLLGEDVLAEDLDAVADGEDGGCADEEGAEGSVLVARDLARQVGLERVDLGAEKVAVHGDVEAAEELLPALLRTAVDALGEEDEPRARAPDRTALRLKVAERVEQVPAPADVRHGGRLPAGDDEAVASRQLLRLANLDRLTPRAPDVRAVLGERALNGEHADLHFVVSAHLEVPKYDVR